MINDDLTMKSKYLTYDEIKIYFQYLKQGKTEYRNKIIENHYVFVLSAVKKFDNLHNYNTLREDLISVALIGLIKAVDTFDVEKNIKFMTYASVLIRNEILMFLRKNKHHNMETISLDQEISGETEKVSYMDTICNTEYDILDDYKNREQLEELKSVLEGLDERGKYVITNFYGINCHPIDQKEIAKQLNCSQSYVSRLIKYYLLEMKDYIEYRYEKTKK